MSLIIAARFETFDQAGAAARRLFELGYDEADMHTFYVTQPGAHARYPIGGDQHADPDARGAQWGAIAGAGLLGLLVACAGGFVAARVFGSIWVVLGAAGVGAYLGAFGGALWISGRHKRLAAGRAQPGTDHPAIRYSGVLLALRVDPVRQVEAADVLKQAGGMDLERANGRWERGQWQDFDPLTPPDRVAPSMRQDMAR